MSYIKIKNIKSLKENPTKDVQELYIKKSPHIKRK